ADGEVGQDLAVDFDPRLVQPVDKAAVGQAVLTHGGVDALDPERTEGALLGLAVAVGVLQALVDSGLGRADGVLAPAIEALGSLQNLLVLGVGGNAPLDARHVDNSLRSLNSPWLSCRACIA